MRLSLFAAALLVVALVAQGCSRPIFMYLINNTGGRIEILHASGDGDRTETLNGSRWYVPFRTNPALAHGYRFEIGWPDIIEIASGGCRMWFSIPPEPNQVEGEEAEIWGALGGPYGYESTLQLDRDLLLYRAPGSDRPVDVATLRQPHGYPLAPTEQSGACETKPPS